MTSHNQLPAEFRPMLSAAIRTEKDFRKFSAWPYLVSPKLDGIRIFISPQDGAVTRTMKPIRNTYLRSQFLQLLARVPEFGGLDGEIIAGPPTPASLSSPSVFQDTTSAVMSYDGQPEVTYWVFDAFLPQHPNLTYMERQKHLGSVMCKISQLPHDQTPSIHVCLLECEPVGSLDELLHYESQYLERGFEGLMLRNIDRPYRFGRSSIHGQQQHLVKLKRTEDAEAIIIGFEELQHNDNPNEGDAFGLAKRSSAKENLKPAGTLGALRVKCVTGDFQGKEFSIGSGFDTALRDDIWRHRDSYNGRQVTFKYQSQGVKDLPRFPIFKGFREDI